MSDTEGKRAQREALSNAATPMTSRRAEVWAGMMRYLTGEARREHEKADQERGGKKRGEESGPKGD
jgi:Spy/CpxP family protein refolding chaperone